jgi:hypothetical protein
MIFINFYFNEKQTSKMNELDNHYKDSYFKLTVRVKTKLRHSENGDKIILFLSLMSHFKF